VSTSLIEKVPANAASLGPLHSVSRQQVAARASKGSVANATTVPKGVSQRMIVPAQVVLKMQQVVPSYYMFLEDFRHHFVYYKALGMRCAEPPKWFAGPGIDEVYDLLDLRWNAGK